MYKMNKKIPQSAEEARNGSFSIDAHYISEMKDFTIVQLIHDELIFGNSSTWLYIYLLKLSFENFHYVINVVKRCDLQGI